MTFVRFECIKYGTDLGPKSKYVSGVWNAKWLLKGQGACASRIIKAFIALHCTGRHFCHASVCLLGLLVCCPKLNLMIWFNLKMVLLPDVHAYTYRAPEVANNEYTVVT